MNKLVSTVIAIGLILLGIDILAGNTILPMFFPYWQPWQMWPITVLFIGALFALVAVLGSFKRRGLGALWIPAAPILTTGMILFAASVFSHWGVWSLLWPLEVLGVAAGFILAAIFTRNVWLGIPAIIVGMNGLVLAFCNTTGAWSSWSVLWTIEPLSLGFILLLVAAKTRSLAVTIVGLSFCGFAFLAFTGMTALLGFNGFLFRAAGPAMLILLGAGLLLANFARTPAEMDRPNANNG